MKKLSKEVYKNFCFIVHTLEGKMGYCESPNCNGGSSMVYIVGRTIDHAINHNTSEKYPSIIPFHQFLRVEVNTSSDLNTLQTD